MAKLKVVNRFGVIPNSLLNNKTISWKAKGLFGYLQSKPDDRNFAVSRICKDAIEGRDGTNNGLKELENAGYLQREKFKNDKGQWDIQYILYDTPISIHNASAVTAHPSTAHPSTDKALTNKKIPTKKELSKKEGERTQILDKKSKPEKQRHLDAVMLTDEEHKKLIDIYGSKKIEQYIYKLDNYIGSKGKRYKSHYKTLLVRLDRDGIKKIDQKPKQIIEEKKVLTNEERKSNFEKLQKLREKVLQKQ